ncbi:hypothetical protein INR49_025863 [Caranx melampygus]|nr:hypothetical protein INR49_025863 [Caranx melampygus]
MSLPVAARACTSCCAAHWRCLLVNLADRTHAANALASSRGPTLAFKWGNGEGGKDEEDIPWFPASMLNRHEQRRVTVCALPPAARVIKRTKMRISARPKDSNPAVNPGSQWIGFSKSNGVWYQLLFSQPQWSQQEAKVLQACQLVCSQILFPAGGAEEVEGKVGATLPFEPDIHIGPGAVIALTCHSDLPCGTMSSELGLSVSVVLEEAASGLRAAGTWFHEASLLLCEGITRSRAGQAEARVQNGGSTNQADPNSPIPWTSEKLLLPKDTDDAKSVLEDEAEALFDWPKMAVPSDPALYKDKELEDLEMG